MYISHIHVWQCYITSEFISTQQQPIFVMAVQRSILSVRFKGCISIKQPFLKIEK